MTPLTIYLAGSIRDGYIEDIQWREDFIFALQDRALFLNPLGGKVCDPATKVWSMHGLVPSTAHVIVKQDFWCVDRADLIVFNFRALSQGYPNIGTLVEFGRATGRGCLMYSIIAPDYTGHENTAMFALHPFLVEASTIVFNTVEECRNFMYKHLPVLSGLNPHFGATIERNIGFKVRSEQAPL